MEEDACTDSDAIWWVNDHTFVDFVRTSRSRPVLILWTAWHRAIENMAVKEALMYLSKAGIAVYAARLDGSASRLQSWLQLNGLHEPATQRRARCSWMASPRAFTMGRLPSSHCGHGRQARSPRHRPRRQTNHGGPAQPQQSRYSGRHRSCRESCTWAAWCLHV